MKIFNKLRFSFRRLFSDEQIKMLCVGMEHSDFAGDLFGCQKAVGKFYNATKSRCDYAKWLKSKDATRENVIKELKKVCKSDLAIFVFNGHGGQCPGKKYETDGLEEFIGFVDGPLYDNEIWDIISQAAGRVFVIFDCCYGGGMYRDRDSQMLRPSLMPRNIECAVDILCWGSCDENHISYMALNRGGLFINLLTKLY